MKLLIPFCNSQTIKIYANIEFIPITVSTKKNNANKSTQLAKSFMKIKDFKSSINPAISAKMPNAGLNLAVSIIKAANMSMKPNMITIINFKENEKQNIRLTDTT